MPCSADKIFNLDLVVGRGFWGVLGVTISKDWKIKKKSVKWDDFQRKFKKVSFGVDVWVIMGQFLGFKLSRNQNCEIS